MTTKSQDVAILIGRMLFSILFIMAGMDKILHFDTAVQYLASEGVPYAQIVLIVAVVLEVLGGLMVFLGWKTRLGAFFLFLFVVPVSLVAHDWANLNALAQANQLHHFYKNVTILGALLYMIGFGGGRLSLDSRD